MRLIYHPDAEAELVAAARFYQQQVPGLGAEFLAAIDGAIGVIQDVLDRWKIVEKGVRRYLVSRFPYGIYYRMLPGEVRILAFKHHSRHPGYWRGRLAD